MVLAPFEILRVLHLKFSQRLLKLPLLASAYGFSQVNAKTDDGFFLGFPSYWNIVAFYLYVLRTPEWVSVSVIAILSILTFVPTHYIYATRGGPFARLINIGAAVWFVMLVAAMLLAGCWEIVGAAARPGPACASAKISRPHLIRRYVPWTACG